MIDPDIRKTYAVWTRVSLRYADTDRQGHVNNAVFSTFLEAGRVELLLQGDAPLNDPGAAFVIARLVLDFKAEINWPGEVWIGSRVARIGRSSTVLEQAIFQGEVHAAQAESVAVQMNEATRRAHALGPATLARLEALRANP